MPAVTHPEQNSAAAFAKVKTKIPSRSVKVRTLYLEFGKMADFQLHARWVEKYGNIERRHMASTRSVVTKQALIARRCDATMTTLDKSDDKLFVGEMGYDIEDPDTHEMAGVYGLIKEHGARPAMPTKNQCEKAVIEMAYACDPLMLPPAFRTTLDEYRERLT